MSMPALLSHFGIQKSRYVTTAGEIVFDGVTQTPTGYTHAAHGAVTPVARHTFHGGEDTPGQSGSNDDAAWWVDATQIDPHIEAMARAFPGFRYAPASEGLPPSWIGEINTGRGSFDVRIVLRGDRGLPRVTVLGAGRLGMNRHRRWMPAPHLFANGDLCVADRKDWDVETYTAATVTAWAAHWLAAYTEWRITRRWPVEGAQSVAS